MSNRFERFLPVAGILAGVVYGIGEALAGSHPAADKSATTQLTWYAAHQGRVSLSAIAGALFLVLMAFFATGIRQALRSGENGESTYSSVAYAGGILVGLLISVWTWIDFAIVQAADKGEAQAVHTLVFLTDVGWLPWTAASAVLMLGTGLGGLRTAALPKWLAIVTIVLGVLNLAGPGGIVVFFVTPLWLIVVGVVLLRRLSTSGASTPTPSLAGVAS